jgi:cytochrome P450
MALAPGLSRWIPVPIGWVGRMGRDPLRFLLEVRERFGDVARLDVGPWRFHLISHPDHVRHVLLDHQRNYPRSWLYDRTKVAAGTGLVTTEGGAWRRLRRMSQPAFHHDRIAALVGVMADEAEALRRRWLDRAAGSGGSFRTELSHEFETLTLRVVGRALLGTDLADSSEALGPPVTELMSYTLHRLNNRLAPPPWVPTPRNIRFNRTLRSFDALIAEILARRRSASGDVGAPDLLAMLLDVRDEETGAGLSDRELRDQVVTFLVAGYETTAIGLTWTFYLLSRHPGAWERVRAEVESVLGDRTPTAADLPRLAFTRRVFDEALRHYPPVYAVARDAARADTIGGFDIPARSTVILSPYVTHRHPEFWPDPEAFDPDRFTPERSEGRPRFAWYPFLGGPHQCIGQEFALSEALVAITAVARSFRLTLSSDAVVEPEPVLTIRPKGGMYISIESVGIGQAAHATAGSGHVTWP